MLYRLKLALRRNWRGTFGLKVKTTPRLQAYFEEFPWLSQLVPFKHTVEPYEFRNNFSNEFIRRYKGVEVRRLDEATVAGEGEFLCNALAKMARG